MSWHSAVAGILANTAASRSHSITSLPSASDLNLEGAVPAPVLSVEHAAVWAAGNGTPDAKEASACSGIATDAGKAVKGAGWIGCAAG